MSFKQNPKASSQPSKAKSFLVLILSVFISLFSLNSFALNVDIFPMLHPNKAYTSESPEYEMMMRSQHALMIFLKENAYSTVFVESNFENILEKEVFNESTNAGRDALLMKRSTEIHFNDGKFPDFYEDMTSLQKEILLDQSDAVNLMFILGHVKAVMATCNQEQYSNWVLNNVNRPDLVKYYSIAIGIKKAKDSEELDKAKRIYAEITTNREVAALDRIEEFRKKNPDIKSVSLVFGAAHDFEAYKDRYPELRLRKINLKRYQKSRDDLFKSLNMSPLELELKHRKYDPFYLDPVSGTYQLRMNDF